MMGSALYILAAVFGAVMYRYRGGGFQGGTPSTFLGRVAWLFAVAALFSGATGSTWLGLGAGLGAMLGVMATSHGEYYDAGMNDPGSSISNNRWLDWAFGGISSQFWLDFAAMVAIGAARGALTVLVAWVATVMATVDLQLHDSLIFICAFALLHAAAYAAGRALYAVEVWVRQACRRPTYWQAVWMKYNEAGEVIFGASIAVSILAIF